MAKLVAINTLQLYTFLSFELTANKWRKFDFEIAIRGNVVLTDGLKKEKETVTMEF